MIKSKQFNRLTGVLMVLALVVAIVLRYFPDTISINNTSVAFEYESKLFDKDSIMSINIVVDEDDWNDLISNATAKEYIQCDIQINGETFQSVGIRAKGNTSLSSVASDDTTDRYSFKVEFDHYVKNQTCYGLDKLALNNIIQDATYMKEYMSYDLLTYMGIPTSLYSYADVSVNGETWGLYLALEVPEESYAERNFGTSYGDLYKPESTNIGGENFDVTDMKETMKDFAANTQAMFGQDAENSESGTTDEAMPEMPSLDESGTMDFSDFAQDRNGGGMMGAGSGCDLAYTGDDLDNYSAIWESSVFDTTDADHERVVEALKNISEGNLKGYLDVDTMLRYIAVNSVIVNYDSYFGSLQHNYYLYEKNGELTMLPWDYNLAFAGFQSNDATSAVNDPIDTPVSGTTLDARPLVGQVLAVEEYQEQYHEYLSQIVSEYFDSGYWAETIDKIDALISDYVENDPTAFYTFDEYKTAVKNLKEFGLLRAESITGQLDGTIPSTQEGQSQDSSALIDASNVSIAAMGTQGGGQMGQNQGEGGMKGMFGTDMGTQNQGEQMTMPEDQTGENGRFMPRGNGQMPQGFPNMKEDTTTANDASTTQAGEVNQEMTGGQMMMPDWMSEEEQEVDLQSVAINLVCVVLAIAALMFVKFNRRRR